MAKNVYSTQSKCTNNKFLMKKKVLAKANTQERTGINTIEKYY